MASVVGDIDGCQATAGSLKYNLARVGSRQHCMAGREGSHELVWRILTIADPAAIAGPRPVEEMNLMRAHLKTLTLALVILTIGTLAGCNMPGVDGGGPTAIPTSTMSQNFVATASSTIMATATTPPPTLTPWQADPNITPIPHVSSGAQLDLTWINMISVIQGWAIGGTAGRSDHVFTTLDGGGNWLDVTPPQAADVGIDQAASGFFLDAQTGWVVYYPQDGLDGIHTMALIVWHTQDGGASWSRGAPLSADLSGSSEAFPELAFINGQTGWIMLHLGAAGMHRYPIYLLRTQDGGVSWETLIDPFNAAYLQSCPKSGWTFEGDTGLVSIGSCPVDSAAIDWSLDGGLTWTDLQLPFPSSHADLAGNAGCQAHSPVLIPAMPWTVAMDCRTFDDPPRDLHFLYRSSDGGANWTISDYPGGSLFFLDPQNAWAFGREIYRTTDGGYNWTRISTVTWDGQFDVVDSQTIFAIARSGSDFALVKSRNGGGTWAIVETSVGQ